MPHVPPALHVSCSICTCASLALVPYVPCVLHAFVPNARRALCVLVPYVPRVLRDLLSHVTRALRAVEPHVPRALCVIVLYVPLAIPALVLHFSCVSRALYSMFSRAFLALFPYASLVSHTLLNLCGNILSVPLSHNPIFLFIYYVWFFEGNSLKTEEIYFVSNTLKLRSAVIVCMICLNYWKSNIYETKSYFGATKGEFEAQHNNLKKSFTRCTGEKATQNSNAYRT